MPRDVLGYYNRGVGGAAGVWWVEARDTDAHTMPRAALITKNYLFQNVDSATFKAFTYRSDSPT